MTPLRVKRLLLLAKYGGWHKRFYSQYCELIQAGLIQWILGTAFLTEAGEIELERLLLDERIQRPCGRWDSCLGTGGCLLLTCTYEEELEQSRKSDDE